MFDHSRRTDGTFERADFTYDVRRDLYTCPGGKELRRYWQAGRAAKEKPPADGLYRYRARQRTVRAVISALAAVPLSRVGSSFDRSMRGRAIWRAISPKPMPG